jgi:serine/threonine protein kinase
MKSSPTKCDSTLLQRSLEDVLSEQQEDWLVAHLEVCTECQQAMAGLAGDRNGWSRVETALRNEVSGTYSLERGMISSLVPGKQEPKSGPSQTIGGRVLPTDFAVDFLEPSMDAGSLGRLNDIEIREVIGHGGNGIVLKGYQKELNRLVAVKVMAPQLATSAAARQRFAREAQATAAIVHPNVMPVLTVHSQSQLPYLVMPYIDCESLQQRLDREGSLATLDVLRIGYQVARGLAAAHAQGLVHRDVKPANILLARNVDRVMLTDFGLARAVDDATLTGTGLIAGTPLYMSPEQARGNSVSTSSDLFSLGSVMYAMSAGRPPFRAQTSYGILRRVIDDKQRPIGELNPEIPMWMEGLINRLLSKECDSRFATADEVATTLQDCIAHLQQPHNNPLSPAAQTLVNSHPRSHRLTQRMFGGLKRHKSLLFASLAVAFVLTLPYSGVFEPDNTLPNLVSDPPVSISNQPAGKSAHLWDDGVGEDLRNLDAKMDEVLRALDADIQLIDKTRK